MSETMYITGVVIANGIPDSDGDVLDKKDIKTIFTKFLDQSSDVLHDRIKHDKIYVLANWISGVDVEIAGKVAPAGSWLTTLAVDNEEVKTAVNKGELKGLSLGSVSDDALTREKWFINKAISYKELIETVGNKPTKKTYSDLDSIEEVHPFWISIVDKPANQFGFEVADYTAFINKRASEEVDTMANEKEIEDKISISGWSKITQMFHKEDTAIDKSEEVIDKAVDEPTATDDISNKELLEAIPSAVAEGVKLAMSEMKSAGNDDEVDKSEGETAAESSDEESDIDKAEEKADETETDEDDDIDKSEDGKSEEVDDTRIDKRQTEMPTNIDKSQAPSPSFYERTGRDAMGRKIRK